MGRRAALALVVIAVGLSACGRAQVRTAPFRERPDSVKAGSLLGPFDGKVVDESSGDPVSGALVYATWSYQSGYGLHAPSGFGERVTSTDAGGRYSIDELDDVPEGAFLTDFYVVIYKRGYVAYRSDRRFEDMGARLDFAQHQNEVRLGRWRGNYSHARHLRFIGGGSAIAALTAWEIDLAAAELSGEAGGQRMASDLVIRRGAITAAQIVTEDDLRDVTGFDGTFETGPLNDEPDTREYSSQHFRALGQPETFDVAVRLWQLDSQKAEARYEELRTTLPEVTSTDEIADRSLRASEQEIFGIAFLDSSRGVVVLMTCGQAQCKTIDQLLAVGRKAHDRIRRLVPENSGRPAPAQPAEPSPTPAAPPRSAPATPPPTAPNNTPSKTTTPAPPPPTPSSPSEAGQ